MYIDKLEHCQPDSNMLIYFPEPPLLLLSASQGLLGYTIRSKAASRLKVEAKVEDGGSKTNVFSNIISNNNNNNNSKTIV